MPKMPLDAIVDELAIVAGRIERESALRIEAAISDLRRIDSERELRLVNLERAVADRLALVKDGTSVTADDLAPMVVAAVGKAVAALPPVAPGQPGKDADPAMIKSLVLEAVSAIPPAKDGQDGAPGLPGADGRSVTPEDVLPAIRALLEERVAAMPVPKDGRDGKDGIDGQAGAPGVPGEKGDPGERGEPGEKGVDGIPGTPGMSGQTGETGQRGEQGLPGDRGEKGDPGDPGERGELGEKGDIGRLAIVKAWEDRVHYEGETVVRNGATFQALRDTGRAPPHDDWQCIAAAGRDGSDGHSLTIRGTYAEGGEYAALDIVALNGASFAAKKDNPGPCPGDGWQLIAKQGGSGKPGERGPQGQKGDPGPGVVSLGVDGEGLLTLRREDGSVIECDLYPVLAKRA